jgi:hypothetical protein
VRCRIVTERELLRATWMVLAAPPVQHHQQREAPVETGAHQASALEEAVVDEPRLAELIAGSCSKEGGGLAEETEQAEDSQQASVAGAR